MGTRSTTRIYDGEHMLLALYCQFDGYPEGVGEQLAEFMVSRPFVNGIGGDSKVFNGPQCFAAQLVAHLKDKAGLWYITGREDQREEYNYEIRLSKDENYCVNSIRFVCEGYGKTFDGDPKDFKAWAKQLNEEEEN